MNSSDGGNLIHKTHFSSELPKEDRGKQSLTITYLCFSHLLAPTWQDYTDIYLINNVIKVINNKNFLKFPFCPLNKALVV